MAADPRKFRIIKDSWNKTDKHDARNLAKALWVHVVTGSSRHPDEVELKKELKCRLFAPGAGLGY